MPASSVLRPPAPRREAQRRVLLPEHTVDIEVLPQQAEFVGDPLEWSGIRGGVGSGKTFAVSLWTYARMGEFPLAGTYAIGANFEQLRQGFFQTFLTLLEEVLHWERGVHFAYRENPSPMVTFFTNGAKLRSLSADQRERIRSVEIQTMVLEEPQTWEGGEETYRTISARLRHSRRSTLLYPEMPVRGRLSFNPTPKNHWLYRVITEQWPKRGFRCYQFSLRQNVLLQGLAEYIKGRETDYPQERWASEIEGDWSKLGGDVYRGYDPDRHTKAPEGFPPIALDESKPLLWAWDFNVGFMCTNIAQMFHQPILLNPVFDKGTGQTKQLQRVGVPEWQRHVIYTLDEICLPDSGVPDVLEQFLARYGKLARKVGVYLYGDATGGARVQAFSAKQAVRSNWGLIVDTLRRDKIPITWRVQSDNPNPFERVLAVRQAFYTGGPPGDMDTGYGRLIDADRCPELVTDWYNVKFKPGTNEIQKKNEPAEEARRTHASDADGYRAWVIRQLRKNGPNSINWTLVR